MALSIFQPDPTFERNSNHGKCCEVETICRRGDWFLIFNRDEKEVFRVRMYGQSQFDFAEEVFNACGEGLLDFINAEVAHGCSGLQRYLRDSHLHMRLFAAR